MRHFTCGSPADQLSNPTVSQSSVGLLGTLKRSDRGGQNEILREMSRLTLIEIAIKTAEWWSASENISAIYVMVQQPRFAHPTLSSAIVGHTGRQGVLRWACWSQALADPCAQPQSAAESLAVQLGDQNAALCL